MSPVHTFVKISNILKTGALIQPHRPLGSLSTMKVSKASGVWRKSKTPSTYSHVRRCITWEGENQTLPNNCGALTSWRLSLWFSWGKTGKQTFLHLPKCFIPFSQSNLNALIHFKDIIALGLQRYHCQYSSKISMDLWVWSKHSC